MVLQKYSKGHDTVAQYIFCSPFMSSLHPELFSRVSSMSGQIAGVELTCSQDSLAKFSSRNSSTVWHFSVQSLTLLKGVTLLGVEHLQHFALDDVALVRTEGDFLFKSKGQECVLEKEEDKEREKEEEETVATAAQTSTQPTTYKYTFKLKFHTKIFGTFKQTLVLDFGVRPLLSKVIVKPSWL